MKTRQSPFLGTILLLITTFSIGEISRVRAQERRQAVNTQIKFVCSNGSVASYDEFATVRVSIGNRPIKSPLTDEIPIGVQTLTIVTKPPANTWIISDIRFLDLSDLSKPGWKTFMPNTPEANVSLNLSPRYGTSISRLEITVDQCGIPVPQNVVRISLPQDQIRPWCAGSKNLVKVEEVPAGRSSADVMVKVAGGDPYSGGSLLKSYDLDQGAYDVPDKSLVYIPPGNGWRVFAQYYSDPAYPNASLSVVEGNTLFRFGCEREPTAREALSVAVELSGGVINFFLSAHIADTPEYRYIVRTTGFEILAFGKLRRTPRAFSGAPRTEVSLHHTARPTSQEQGTRFTVDARDNRGTVCVSEGEVRITPKNPALRPFDLRAGQRVEVTLTGINGPTPASTESASVPSIKVKKPVYAPNERIEVEYANHAGHIWDWIVVARVGEGAQSAMGGDLGNKWSSRIGDQRSGVRNFDSLQEGNYEARYVSWDGGNNRITARSPFTVGNVPPPKTGGTSGSTSNPSTTSSSSDLSGLWVDDTGGGAIYRLRQVGNKLYWGVDAISVGSFANVYDGEISGNTITGEWRDLPGSPTLSGGSLILRIESNDRLVKVSSSNYYGAQIWTRKGVGAKSNSVVGLSQRVIPALAGKWEGTWNNDNGLETVNISVAGNSLTASFRYSGGDFSGTGQWTECRVEANTAKCKYTINHDDNSKSGIRQGTLEMRLNGDTMSGTYYEGEPQWSWKPGYGPHNVTSKVYKGAVFPVSFKRQQ